MITGNCLVVVRRDIRDVIAEAPPGEVALFEVVVNRDEHLLGEVLYVKDNVFRDPVTDKIVKGVAGDQVKFIRYIAG